MLVAVFVNLNVNLKINILSQELSASSEVGLQIEFNNYSNTFLQHFLGKKKVVFENDQLKEKKNKTE